MNIIINSLISSFIAHGFLDFYTFKHLNDLSIYVSIIAIYMYIITLSPDFGVAGFVVSSIYHFGQDFKYFDQLLEVNQKLWKVEDELRIHEKSQDFGDDLNRKAVAEFEDLNVH